MLNLLFPIILAGASSGSIDGLWSLPGKNNLELFIAEKNGSITAMLKMDVSCKPMYLMFYGTLSYNKNKIVLSLESKRVKVSNECEMIAALISSGKVNGNRYKTKAIVISQLICSNNKSKITIDSINGVWKRKFTPKKKLPKRQFNRKGVSI